MTQRSWRTFPTLPAALGRTRGRTAAAVRLVAENVPADERVLLVATGEVKALWSWEDGAVVLTEQRLLVAESPDSGSGSLSQVDLHEGPELTEMQGWDDTCRFRVTGLEVQGIGLRAEQFAALRIAVQHNLDELRAAAARPSSALQSIGLLAQLRLAGLLTAEEFSAKQRLVLHRLGDGDRRLREVVASIERDTPMVPRLAAG